jgi:hypothetical protein
MSFSSLPPEFRMMIFREIIQATRHPSHHDLRNYQGLILTSQALYVEFESEVIQSTREFH